MPKPGFKQRAERRKKRIVGHVAMSYEAAEHWDLEYWQQRSPQERLSVLAAIHRDVAAVDPKVKLPATRWNL